MGKFFLGILTCIAGTIAVTVVGNKLDRKIINYIFDAMAPNKPGAIPDTDPDSIPREGKEVENEDA